MAKVPRQDRSKGYRISVDTGTSLDSATTQEPSAAEVARPERVSLYPLDAETALRGLLAVDPPPKPASDPDE